MLNINKNSVMKKNAILLILLLFQLIGYSQDIKSLEKIRQQTNVDALIRFSEENLKQSTINKENADRKAKEKGWLIQKTDEKGSIELIETDFEGKPYYYSTTNLNAARTTSTIKLWPGRTLGLNLSGQGIKLAEWDAGKVRTTHQEFGGRVTQKDNATILNDHSTHVAGTLIASGAYDSTARGMAWQAELDTYDWLFDISEMSLAAANGLLFSNHSYVTLVGWNYISPNWYWYGDTTISTTEDLYFGFYDTKSKQMDFISYNAPYYLIVKAAGNNNNIGPSAGTTHYVWNGNNWVFSTTARPKNGPYDCLPTFSVAKNILTIGNVQDIYYGYSSPSDVAIFSSSSTGPTDDGRIKPDICGNGTGLKSTISTSNSAYDIYTGTSMATPNVMGSLALLQQHFNNKFNRYMKSATVKALAIHTADEAGTYPGPDYIYGWGLLNTSTAAITINNADSNALIRELSLKNQDTCYLQIYSSGTTPLTATIAWTDPEGEPANYGLDPQNLMLVNDLDIRILKNDSVWYPWVLNPASPSNAAFKDDNFRDNVEKINITNPSSGIYTIRISHKGNLKNEKQDFSLIVSGIIINSPKNFIATAVSSDSIRLNWKLNQNNPVLIAYSLNNSFGQPIDNISYAPGDNIAGGGKVLYKGNDTLFYHKNLQGNTKYNYRIWTVIEPNPDYSMPSINDANTFCTSLYPEITENFNDTIIPDCWRQQNYLSMDGWLLNNSGYAGGDSLELLHLWEDVSDFTGNNNTLIPVSRMILPPFNTVGLNNMKIQFKSFYKDHQGWGGNGANIRLQSSSDGINWTNENFSHTSGSGDLISNDTVVSILNNLNHKNTYLAFTLEGNFYHIWYWAIDDIKVFEQKKSLTVKLFPEGLWNGNNLIKVQNEFGNQYDGEITDKIKLKLHDTLTYGTVFSSDSNTYIDTSGIIKLNISKNFNTHYYISINHRNHIETWSSIPVTFTGDTIYFDFTTSASKAFGSNQKQLKSGVYGIYSGDVNQDGLVDGSDMSDTETDNNAFVSGYVVTDINGDGIVDGSDMSMVETNNNAFVGVINPY